MSEFLLHCAQVVASGHTGVLYTTTCLPSTSVNSPRPIWLSKLSSLTECGRCISILTEDRMVPNTVCSISGVTSRKNSAPST